MHKLPQDCDPVTAYIFQNYLPLLTEAERLAYRSIIADIKADGSSPAMAAMLRKHWGTTDPAALHLLKDGLETFYRSVRDRIVSECSSAVHFNRCSKCGELARTPTACLCPACNHTWYETRVR